MTPRFEQIDGNLCLMLEQPILLTPDAKFPCVVRLIQDDSPMGRYNKWNCPNKVLADCVILNTCPEETVLHKDVHRHISKWEVLGYPVEDGSEEWAWYQLKHGNPVSNKQLFIGGGYIRDTDSDLEPFCKMWNKPDGWQLYEPEQKKPEYIICKQCGGGQSVPNPKVSATAYTACPRCGGTGYEIKEPEPQFKVGDWVECEGIYGVLSEIDKSKNECTIETAYEYYAMRPLDKLVKVSASEFVINIVFLSGTVRKCVATNGTGFELLNNGEVIAWIAYDALDAPTRELVQSLLKAQEEKLCTIKH